MTGVTKLLNYSLELAKDPIEMMESFERTVWSLKRYSLILINLQKFGKTGLDAIKMVRTIEKREGLPESVIFAIYGEDAKVQEPLALKAGASRVVEGSVKIEEIKTFSLLNVQF